MQSIEYIQVVEELSASLYYLRRISSFVKKTIFVLIVSTSIQIFEFFVHLFCSNFYDHYILFLFYNGKRRW